MTNTDFSLMPFIFLDFRLSVTYIEAKQRQEKGANRMTTSLSPIMDKKLPIVLGKEEVKRILEASGNLKHRTILMITYSGDLELERW